MSPSRTATVRIVAGIAWIVAGMAPAVHAQNAAKKLLVGDAKVEVIAKYQGDPLPKPEKVLVSDFEVPGDVVSLDASPAARVHRRRAAAEAASSPEAVARQVQAAFSNALVKELQQASVPTAAVAGADTPPPPRSLLVKGDFTAVNQGNKTKRVLIGFGKGASDVQAHVTVSLVTEQEPVVVLEFNAKSQSGKKPGAAATVGAGAATMGTVSAPSAAVGVGAGGVFDQTATVEADASRMAKAVAKQIAQLMTSQPWATAPQ
jgi:Domain of unknown function (DUF4410)